MESWPQRAGATQTTRIQKLQWNALSRNRPNQRQRNVVPEPRMCVLAQPSFIRGSNRCMVSLADSACRKSHCPSGCGWPIRPTDRCDRRRYLFLGAPCQCIRDRTFIVVQQDAVQSCGLELAGLRKASVFISAASVKRLTPRLVHRGTQPPNRQQSISGVYRQHTHSQLGLPLFRGTRRQASFLGQYLEGHKGGVDKY